MAKVCSSCGAPLEDNMKFCEQCGAAQTAENLEHRSLNVLSEPIVQSRNKRNKITAGVLGILLGGIGAHKFYLGKITMGIIYLLACWTGIPVIIGLIEGIKYLIMSPEEFDAKFNN